MIQGFWHVVQATQWATIVHAQGARLRSSGLLEATDGVQVGVLGDAAVPDFGAKVAVRYRASDVERFEFPTLQLMWHYAREHEGAVWYIHTKGVCNPRGRETDAEQTLWREKMEGVVIDQWGQCLAALDGHDAAGPFWSGHMFAGNFWWATTQYLRTLPRPAWRADRIWAEKWINCQQPPVRACNVGELRAPGGIPVLG